MSDIEIAAYHVVITLSGRGIDSLSEDEIVELGEAVDEVMLHDDAATALQRLIENKVPGARVKIDWE